MVGEKKFSFEPLGASGPERAPFQPTAAQPQHGRTQFQLSPEVTRQIQAIEEKVMKELKKKAAQIERQAYEQGYAQGENDGLERGQKKLEIVIRQMGSLLREIETRKEELFQTFEQEMVDLAFSLIKKVLRRESRLTEGVVKDTLRAAFNQVEENRRVVLHLNPGDYKYLLRNPDQLPFVLQDRARIKIIEDGTVTSGGCLLETEYGVIDATIEGQFDQIVERIPWPIDNPVPQKNQIP